MADDAKLKTISIRGAREHKLKSIALELPREHLIVVAGLWGSGTSSRDIDLRFIPGTVGRFILCS